MDIKELAATVQRLTNLWAPDETRRRTIQRGLAGDETAHPYLVELLRRIARDGRGSIRGIAARTLETLGER